MKIQITELWDLLVDNGLATEQTLQVITSINGYTLETLNDVDNGLATEQTLQVITSINGYTLETLNDVLYAITGCRCIEQYHAEGVQIDAIA